jgi:hypothetical protein
MTKVTIWKTVAVIFALDVAVLLLVFLLALLALRFVVK